MRRFHALTLVAMLGVACRDATRPIVPVADNVAAAPADTTVAFAWVPLETRGANFLSSARAVNNQLQAVGWASVDEVPPCTPGVPCPPARSHAALWQDGVMQDLGTLGGASSEATEVNARGQVVGWSDAADGGVHGFLWERGTLQDLGPIERYTLTSPYSFGWYAANINDVGQVVGNRPGGGPFLWENGVSQALPLDFVTDINNRGDVVGWVLRADTAGVLKRRAALWRDGAVIELGTLGGDESWATAIGNNGWVSGTSQTEPRPFMGGMSRLRLPFRWRGGAIEGLANCGINASACPVEPFVSAEGWVVVLDAFSRWSSVWNGAAWRRLSPSSPGPATALAMNGAGVISGVRGSFGFGPGFVWQDGVFYDLNSPVSASSWGRDINEAGVVVGHTGPLSRPQAAKWLPVGTGSGMAVVP